MYKLFVLAALFAVAAARPSHFEAPPLVYSAPATVIHEPAYAKVGAVVKSIPTAVSHQSQSIVHSSAHVVEPIVAPVVRTTYAHPSPLVHTYAAAPVVKSYAAPVVQAYAAAPHYAAPVAYAAPAPWSYAANYAAPFHYSAW